GDVGQLFLRAAAKVQHRGIIFQDAGEDLEVGNPSGEGIGHRFKDIERYWLRIGLVPLWWFSITGRRWVALHPLMLRGRGRVVDDEIHDPVGTDVTQSGAE